MSGIASAIAATAVVGAYSANRAAKTQAQAAKEAAAIQSESTDESLALQEKMYEEGVQRQIPWQEAGTQALQRLQEGLQTGGEFAKKFGGVIDDPSYEFRLKQGQRALDASAAARGNLFTGGQQQAVQEFGQGLASTEYQNAYNRFYDDQQRRLQATQSLAGVGQSVASGLASQGAQFAGTSANIAQTGVQNVNDWMTSGASARAAGQVAVGNQLTGAIGQGIGFMQSQPPLSGSSNAGLARQFNFTG